MRVPDVLDRLQGPKLASPLPAAEVCQNLDRHAHSPRRLRPPHLAKSATAEPLGQPVAGQNQIAGVVGERGHPLRQRRRRRERSGGGRIDGGGRIARRIGLLRTRCLESGIGCSHPWILRPADSGWNKARHRVACRNRNLWSL